MSVASSGSVSPLDSGRNFERTLWLDTFYIGIPFKILSMSAAFPYTAFKVKPTHIDFILEFQFKRISSMHLKFICTRHTNNNLIPNGNYRIQFYIDSNFSDGYTKRFEMKSHELIVDKTFWLNPSCRQDLPSSCLGRHFEFKILIKMIEYDFVSTTQHIIEKDTFRILNEEIFRHESVLNDLCYILNVTRFEDIFTGRQSLSSVIQRSSFIQRAATFSSVIANYMRCKNESITPPYMALEFILNYLNDGNMDRISDENLVKVYIKAHRLGLNFLIVLSQDCILDRLKDYVTLNLSKYEDFMFKALEAAVRVNEEHLFEKAFTHLKKSRDFFNPANLWYRLETTSIDSRFVMRFAERRLKILESNSSLIRIGEASSSNVFNPL